MTKKDIEAIAATIDKLEDLFGEDAGECTGEHIAGALVLDYGQEEGERLLAALVEVCDEHDGRSGHS